MNATLKTAEFSRDRALLYVALSAALWSTSGLFIKLIDLNPLTIAGIRGFIAAIILIAVLNKKLRFNWSFPQVAGALAYSATMILFVSATKFTTAANAILLQYTLPAFTALLGLWILKEKVTPLDWGIIIFVFSGMALFFLDDLTVGGLWGNIMAIISAVTFALMIIFMRMQKEKSTVESIVLGNIITALCCLPFIILEPPAAMDWPPLLYLGIFQLGLPFLLYSTAIKYITALDVVLIQSIEPLLNPIWVLLFIGEVPGPWAIVGGIIVLISVTVRNIYSNRIIPKQTPLTG